MENPDVTIAQLMKKIPGPDFPTAGFIYGTAASRRPMKQGAGLLTLRAKATIESDERTDRERIIVTELPYQVNKVRADREDRRFDAGRTYQGISDLRDESDRDGMRVVIELKRG